MPRVTQSRPIAFDPAAGRRKARIIAALTAVCGELGATQINAQAKQDYREVQQFLEAERARLLGRITRTAKRNGDGQRNSDQESTAEGKRG